MWLSRGARNCRKMTSLDGLLSTRGLLLNRACRDRRRVRHVAGGGRHQFPRGGRPERAEILIGAQVEPEGWAFADVFYDMKSPVPVKPISRALICLNPTRQWKVGFDGDLQRYDLRYTFAHEIGHAIGLDHPMGAGQIMGYRYEERFRELQAGDISGVVRSTAGASPTRSWPRPRHWPRMRGACRRPASTPDDGEAGPSPPCALRLAPSSRIGAATSILRVVRRPAR